MHLLLNHISINEWEGNLGNGGNDDVPIGGRRGWFKLNAAALLWNEARCAVSLYVVWS